MPTVRITENTSGGTHTGVWDTYITEGSLNFFGASADNTLFVATNAGLEDTYAAFNFAVPSLGTITVTSATFRVKSADGGSNPTVNVDLYAILRVWDITDSGVGRVSWNEYDNSTSWNTGGARGSGSDRGASALDTQSWAQSFDAERTFSNAALASYVQTQVNAGNPIRLILQGPYHNGSVLSHLILASNHTDGERPYLEFDYTSGGAADHLTITTQPIDTVVGSTMPNVVVAAKDAGGTTDVTYTTNVVCTLQTGSGTLDGTLTKAAVAGVATFNDLSIDTLNTSAVLRFTSGGITLADSSAFDIIAGSGGGGGSPLDSPLVD